MDHWPELVADARRQIRAFFESMMRERWPRLDDPAFSPLIELERFVLPGGAGLYVLLRSHMIPGYETVTGHTLRPTATGLFDVSWVVGTYQTGARESSLAAQAHLQGRPIPSLDFMDSAVHDDRFPSHVVSIARRQKSWWHGRLELVSPPPAPTRGRITLPDLGCSVVLPPRFAPSQAAFQDWGHAAYFTRASFSCANGIDRGVTLILAGLTAWLPTDAIRGSIAVAFLRVVIAASAFILFPLALLRGRPKPYDPRKIPPSYDPFPKS